MARDRWESGVSGPLSPSVSRVSGGAESWRYLAGLFHAGPKTLGHKDVMWCKAPVSECGGRQAFRARSPVTWAKPAGKGSFPGGHLSAGLGGRQPHKSLLAVQLDEAMSQAVARLPHWVSLSPQGNVFVCVALPDFLCSWHRVVELMPPHLPCLTLMSPHCGTAVRCSPGK